jgi:hypothetical protein
MTARAKTPKVDKPFGQFYACSSEQPSHMTPDGPLWMRRKGQRVRFFDETGEQVGPEQRNVAPALCYAAWQGWIDPRDPATSAWLNAGIRAETRIRHD